MSLASGDVFAGYTIQRLLGSGATGEVYLALHPRLPRPYAVKILAAALTDDADFRAGFDGDAQVAATLSHPHIVGVHDRGEDDGRLWIATDYVEGTDASRLIRDGFGAEMPLADVVAVITAVADALDYAHERELAHGDVTPANILLSDFNSPRRRILLADFGIPRPGGPVDGRDDQYALAATAFQFLTGALPSAPLGAHRPELTRLEPVFATALATDPGQRFPRCLDFAQALRRAVDAQPEPSTVSAQVQMPMGMPVQVPISPPVFAGPAAEPPARRPRSAFIVALILAIVLVGVSAFTTTQFLRPDPKPSTAAPDWQPYVDAARKFAETTMSIHAESPEEDVQRIIDGSTGSLRDDMVKTRDSFVQITKASNVSSTGTAQAAGLQSVDDSRARVLVAVSQEGTNSAGPQEPRRYRMRLDVVKVGDTLKISHMEMVP